MTNNYYSNTAYDTSNKRTLAPISRTDMSMAEKLIRKHPVTIIADQCQEFLVSSQAAYAVLEIQNFTKAEYQQSLDLKLHERIRWPTGKNKKAQVESMVYGAWWFWFFGGIIGGIVVGLVGGFNFGWLIVMMIGFVTPFSIWALGKYALKHNWFKDENNVVFNRRSGMVSFPWQDGTASVPFDEFDAFMATNMTIAATTNLFLRLAHRYSDKNIINPAHYSHGLELFVEWERIQRFIDISKPLPDIPIYDFAREYDPVSVAYDKKHHRPKDYWKNCKYSDVEKMITASNKAAESFPWGETREQAIQDGWLPSDVGEGDWQTKQNMMQPELK